MQNKNGYKGDINESPEVVISGTIDMSHKDPLNAKHFTGVLKGEPGTVGQAAKNNCRPRKAA